MPANLEREPPSTRAPAVLKLPKYSRKSESSRNRMLCKHRFSNKTDKNNNKGFSIVRKRDNAAMIQNFSLPCVPPVGLQSLAGSGLADLVDR